MQKRALWLPLHQKPTFRHDAPHRAFPTSERSSTVASRKESFVGQLQSQNPPVVQTGGDLVSEVKAQSRGRA